MNKGKPHILDPLWITKGSGDIDAEYLKYILLAANKKFREQLELGDLSGFNEIVFHSLNLNNLAVDGTLFDFKLNPKWDDPKLSEIRSQLRRVYQMQNNILEIFRSANYLFSNLLIEYLDQINSRIQESQIYCANPKIHFEKKVFLVLNFSGDPSHHIWKLRFDGRLKMGSRLEFIKTVKTIDQNSDQILSDIDRNKNVILILYKGESSSESIINSVASSISFSRGIASDDKFSPDILQELQEILVEEQVLPFTIKNWI